MLDVLRWTLIVALIVYFAGLMWGVGGLLALYGLEGRKNFYEAAAARTGASTDRLEWAAVLAHFAWPLLWILRDPQFVAARMGTLTGRSEIEYQQAHPNWTPKPRRTETDS